MPGNGSAYTTRQSSVPNASIDAIDDGELLRAAAQGDQACLGEIYRRYWPSMRRHGIRILGSVEAAEDATQEAFAQTIRTINKGREITAVAGWLHTCVHNVCLDTIKERRRHNHAPLDSDEGDPLGPTMHEHARERANSKMVLQTLAQLTKPQRSVFLLAEVQGLDSKRIAEMMGTSASSVRVLLYKARHHIRETMGAEQAGFAGVVLRKHLGITAPERISRHSEWSEHLKERFAVKTGNFGHWFSSVSDRVDPTLAKTGIAALVTASAIAAPVALVNRDSSVNIPEGRSDNNQLASTENPGGGGPSGTDPFPNGDQETNKPTDLLAPTGHSRKNLEKPPPSKTPDNGGGDENDRTDKQPPGSATDASNNPPGGGQNGSQPPPPGKGKKDKGRKKERAPKAGAVASPATSGSNGNGKSPKPTTTVTAPESSQPPEVTVEPGPTPIDSGPPPLSGSAELVGDDSAPTTSGSAQPLGGSTPLTDPLAIPLATSPPPTPVVTQPKKKKKSQ